MRKCSVDVGIELKKEMMMMTMVRAPKIVTNSITRSTFGISSPRAATSVATRTLNRPSRKAAMVLSL